MPDASRSVLVERITVERWKEPILEGGTDIEVLRFSVQHPSHNPAHGAVVGGPPVIHTETIMGRDGDLGPLIRYLNSLLPKMGES